MESTNYPPRKEDAEDTYVVTRDGEPRSGVQTYSACWRAIFHAQPQSVDWACTYEGWSITHVEDLPGDVVPA